LPAKVLRAISLPGQSLLGQHCRHGCGHGFCDRADVKLVFTEKISEMIVIGFGSPAKRNPLEALQPRPATFFSGDSLNNSSLIPLQFRPFSFSFAAWL
jgi:hypothetical protein